MNGEFSGFQGHLELRCFLEIVTAIWFQKKISVGRLFSAPWQVVMQCGLLAGGISPPRTRAEARGVFGLLLRPMAEAEGRERTQRNQHTRDAVQKK